MITYERFSFDCNGGDGNIMLVENLRQTKVSEMAFYKGITIYAIFGTKKVTFMISANGLSFPSQI